MGIQGKYWDGRPAVLPPRPIPTARGHRPEIGWRDMCRRYQCCRQNQHVAQPQPLGASQPPASPHVGVFVPLAAGKLWLLLAHMSKVRDERQ